jgi:hypothetical protein
VGPKNGFDGATLTIGTPTDSRHKRTSKMSFGCEDAMNQRKVYCPETENDCASPNCSIRICVLRTRICVLRQDQERNFAEQRKAAREEQDRAFRKAAAWRVIREFYAEHNALIDANKPGVAHDVNGNIITTRLYIPERRWRDQYQRECLIQRVLYSEKPSTIARLRKAMAAIAAEERARLLKG